MIALTAAGLDADPRSPYLLNGVIIYESIYLTVPEDRVIARTWRERLLSCPWCPWVKTKTVTVQVPDPKVYFTEHGAYVHPQTARRLFTGLELHEGNRRDV